MRRTVTMAAMLVAFGAALNAQPQTADVAVAGGIGAGERERLSLSNNPVEGHNVKLARGSTAMPMRL